MIEIQGVKKRFEGKPVLDGVDLSIGRGDTLVIRPVQARSLAGIVEAFAAFPAGFMAEGREFHVQKRRKWE